MATKKPVCLYSGKLEELKDADDLPIPAGAILFFNSDGSRDDVDVSAGSLLFYNSDGSQDNVNL